MFPEKFLPEEHAPFFCPRLKLRVAKLGKTCNNKDVRKQEKQERFFWNKEEWLWK